MGVDPIRRPVIAAEMERIMNRVELEGTHLSKPMRNAGETLFSLRQLGLAIGIATRGCREYAIESMRLTRLNGYVDHPRAPRLNEPLPPLLVALVADELDFRRLGGLKVG